MLGAAYLAGKGVARDRAPGTCTGWSRPKPAAPASSPRVSSSWPELVMGPSHDRRHRGPYRPRQDGAGEGADRRRCRPPQGGEGARHHHRSRLRLQRPGRRPAAGLRRRAGPRALRAQHAGRRHRHRCRPADRLGGRGHQAADRRASADHRPARPRPRRRGADQGRPRRRRPAPRAHGRGRDAARRDLAQGRGDRAGVGAERPRRRRAEGQASGAGREQQGRHGLRAARRRPQLRAVGRGRRGDGHGPCRRDQGRRPPAADAVGPGGAGALAACPEPAGRDRPRRRALRAQSQPARGCRRTPSAAATGWSVPSCTRRPTGSTCG